MDSRKNRVRKIVGELAIAGMLLSIVTGCAGRGSSSAPSTSSTPTPITGSNLSGADAGRAIFTSACHSCHTTPTISSYSLSTWTNSIIPDMASRARLSSADRQSLQLYINSVLGGA